MVTVTEIESTQQYKDLQASLGPEDLVVIDFHALWCGPCKTVAPFIDSLAAKYTEAKFIKINVDEQNDLAREFKITAMPTFIFIKGGKEVAKIRGASRPELARVVALHCGRDPNAEDTGPALDLQAPGGGISFQRVLLVGMVLWYAYQWWVGRGEK